MMINMSLILKQREELNEHFQYQCFKYVLEHKCQDIILEYENVIHLARELKRFRSESFTEKSVIKGLSGKDKWFAMTEHYKDFLLSQVVYTPRLTAYIQA